MSQLDGLTLAASHPHMFGAQCQWANRYRGRVLVNGQDADWVEHDHHPYELWKGEETVGSRVLLIEMGGHFPGSSYLLWRAPDGEEWLFVSDTTQIRPNGQVTFQWSYPNMLPLGQHEVECMLNRLPHFRPRHALDNFGRELHGDIRSIIVKSARLHLERIQS